MKIQIINSKHIAIFALSCLGVLTLVTLVSRCDEDENVPPALRRYLRFNASASYWHERDHEHQQARGAGGANRSLSELFDRFERRTADLSVLNWGRFGPVQVDTPTVVVLAHRDPERLQYLIVSLAMVRNIQSVLLVFSHSYYDERIDELVLSIDFCKVKQIYYPNSVQLFPTSFPGLDVDDCTNSAADASEFCSHRDGRRCEGKHHWWWTAHTVFDQRWSWLRGHRGPVMFVREDSYVLPDLVYMMAYAQRAVSHFPEVEVIGFGGPLVGNPDYNKLSIATWKPMYENGMAFDRSTWAKIMYESVEFCEYDDASWSYSLLAVFGRWKRGRALSAVAWAPRVVSTAAFSTGRAALTALAPQVRAAATAGRLFPRDVQAVVLYDRDGNMKFERFTPPPRGNGGWADYRDRNLCLEPLMATNTEDDSTTTTPNFDTIKTNSRP